MESVNPPELSSMLILDRVGEVIVTVDPDGFSWKPVDDADSSKSSCLCIKLQSSSEARCSFSNMYAVELIGWGSIRDSTRNAGSLFSYNRSQMYRFVVYGSHINNLSGSPWVLSEYTFAHKDLQTCQAWVDHLNSRINNDAVRPRNLLVFVHPLCGKGNGRQTWERVAPIFTRAKVQTKVVETQRARHAFDTVSSLSDSELNSLDGIVIVGGDGLFNEILNGLLSSRHSAPYPPVPGDLDRAGKRDQNQQSDSCRTSFNDANGMLSVGSSTSDDNEPLLSSSESYRLGTPKLVAGNWANNTDRGHNFSFPNDQFRFGLIPAGSTDAIVLSTTGVRDPVTSALQIVLGKRMSLDIARVVRWKASPSSTVSPSVHYAASFAGYGFYGDVIRESEQHRWMGPKRYDYAGTMAFLKHRSYEAEITFLDAENGDLITGTSNKESQVKPSNTEEDPDKVVCRENCSVCNQAAQSHSHGNVPINSRWSRSKGCFLSIGAAIISCRNERAPAGLVANAHLADGFLHLILIKDCPRPFYLWHLTKLTRRGTNPFNFEFIEHHKTTAFTFVSSHDKGRWNLDGELFQACEATVQVFRGLINLFASGPEI